MHSDWAALRVIGTALAAGLTDGFHGGIIVFDVPWSALFGLGLYTLSVQYNSPLLHDLAVGLWASFFVCVGMGLGSSWSARRRRQKEHQDG